MLNQEWTLEELQHVLDVLVKITIQNHSKLSITEKRRNKTKISDQKFYKSFIKIPSACQTLSKALNISSTTAWVAPDLIKALAILSDTTVREFVGDRWDLELCWKSEKKVLFL